MKGFPRRTLLEVLAGTTATPLIFGARPSRAAVEFPRRLIVLYTQEGLIPELVIPKIPPGPLTTLPPALAPLLPFRSRLNIVGGLAMLSCINQPWEGRPFVSAHTGTVHLLTGAVCEGPEVHPTLGFQQPSGAGGPSVDQFIASRLGQQTDYPSLLFGMNRANKDNGAATRLAFSGKGHAGFEPESDPAKAFDRLFGGAQGDAARIALEQGSVLDYARKRIESARTGLGHVDRQKLEQHLTSLREIESRLQRGRACSAPGRGLTAVAEAGVPNQVARFIELSKLALACDLTRVLSIQIGDSTGAGMGMKHVLLDGQPIAHNEHEVSHTGSVDRRPEKQAACTRWKASVFADLLTALDSVKEGDATLLDHSLVLWTSQMSTPWNHAMAPFTVVTAGGCGGAIKTGQFLTYGEPLALKTRANDDRRVEDSAYSPHNRLLISICHAMGMPEVQEFGTAKYCTKGRLDGLHV